MLQSIAKRVGLALVSFAATSVMAMAQAPQMPPLPIDTAVKIGKLDNGLTYIIRQNKLPEGRAHFYIAQKVGSMQEEENQRGLAHFLEHIAFNGTKNFPGKSMTSWLETLGIKFGANLNAYTGFDETVYQIMGAPTARQSVVDSCLLILHDWSSAISLEDKEIDNERGVIQEEWRQRNSGNLRTLTKTLENAFPNHRYGHRMPIGLMDVVRNFKYDELRAYYKKWYRPDLQGIIVVGDIDPVKVEATIKRLFGAIPKPVNAAERVYPSVPNVEGIAASIATDKEAVGTRITISFLGEPTPKEVRASQLGLIQDYLESIIQMVTAERFSDIIKKPNAPFLGASMDMGDFLVARTKSSVDFAAVAADGGYEAALKAIVAEMERLRQFGITKGEYDRAKKNYLTSLKKRYDERDKRKNDAYIEEYTEYFLQGGYIPGVEFEYKTINAIADQIPVEAFNQVLAQQLAQKENIFLSLIGPDKDGIKYPTTEALISEFKAAREQKVEPLKEEVSDTKLIDKAPKAGKIVKEDKQGKFGSTVWTLSNGVQVIIKPTTFKDDEIRFSAKRSGGSSLFAKQDAAEASVLNAVSGLGGLGKFDASALSKALSGRIASAGTSLGLTTDMVYGSSTKADLETMMQLIYLNFTAKRSDKEAFAAYQEKAINMRKMIEANPMGSVSDSLSRAMYPNNPELLSLTEEQIKALRYDRIMQMHNERFANANGFKFVFVGNIDLAVLRPLVETYIASLPATKAVSKADQNKYPKVRKGVYTHHYTKKQETPMGFVFNHYSGTLPVNQRNRMIMNILSDVLDQVYVETIREKEGGTYGASAEASVSYEPAGAASVSVYYQTDPAKAQHLNKIVNEELQRIAKNGAEKAKFDKVIANYEKNFAERQKENGYWQDQLMSYYYDGRDNVGEYLKVLKSITPQEVGTLLKQLLDQKNTIEMMMLPEETKK